MNRAVPTSVSLAFGSHSHASKVNASAWGWPSDSTVCFPPMLFPEVLNAKQGHSMGTFHFSSLWYASTGHRTQTYRAQSEHSTTGPRMQCRVLAEQLVQSFVDAAEGQSTRFYSALWKVFASDSWPEGGLQRC